MLHNPVHPTGTDLAC